MSFLLLFESLTFDVLTDFIILPNARKNKILRTRVSKKTKYAGTPVTDNTVAPFWQI